MCVIVVENSVGDPRESESRTLVRSGHLLPGIHPKDMEPACQRGASVDGDCSNHHSRG